MGRMRNKGMAWICWLGMVAAGWAQQDTSPQAWLKRHPEAQPKQVVLAQETVFSIVLDGKPVGTTAVAAGTTVDLAEVGDTTLTLAQAAGRAEVDPAKTDFGDRIGAARAARDRTAAADSAAALRLPADSLQADWYAGQIREKFDPWLAAYPDSPLFAEVKARREAFAAEMSRVAAGDERHGERWLASEEFPEWKDDVAADALRLRLKEAAAPSELSGLLAQVPPLAKAGSYPSLVRAALAAIDTMLPAFSAEKAKAGLQAKRDDLAVQDDKLFAELRAAVSKPYLSSPTPQPGWMKYNDNLYHPAPVAGKEYGWYTADHFGELMDYFPDMTTHYEQPPDDVVAQLKEKAAKEKELRGQKAALEKKIEDAVAASGGDRDQVIQFQTKLVAEPVDKREQAVARLPDAAAKLSSGDADGGLAVVKEVEAAWPDSAVVARWKLDQFVALSKDGKSAAVAAALLQGVPDWPRAVRLRAQAALVAAAVPAPAPQAAPPSDGGAGKRHDASRLAWDKAVESARQGQAMEAWNAFREAREQWPENPSVSDAVFYAEAGGGALVLLLLFWLWRRLSSRD